MTKKKSKQNKYSFRDYSLHNSFSKGHLAKIVEMRMRGKTFDQIKKHFETHYGMVRARSTFSEAYRDYGHMFEIKDDKLKVEILRESARVKKNSSLQARKMRATYEYLEQQQGMLDRLEGMVKDLKPRMPKVRLKTSNTTKQKMTMEVMFTDIHMGKIVEDESGKITFNREICEKRTRQFTETILKEYQRYSKLYDIERLIIFLGGDNIENANIHGAESLRGCEGPTTAQVVWYVQSTLEGLLLPLIGIGVQTDIVALGGNHDRQDERKTYNYPSYEAESWIMYKMFEMLTTDYKHVSWDIPKGVYTTKSIYGNEVLYEHGDNVKGTSRSAYKVHINNRSQQVGKLITGMRIGHYHEYTCIDEGRVIVNASVCGSDSYSDVNGYDSKPGQVINYYVKTNSRKSAFYHSFLVQLD